MNLFKTSKELEKNMDLFGESKEFKISMSLFEKKKDAEEKPKDKPEVN